MVFNKDLLFVHTPKAAGMSITRHLLNVLPRPVYYSHPDSDESQENPGVFHIVGLRHESLAEAGGILARYGMDVRKLPVILAAVRNPYDLEVSRYAYLQQACAWDQGHNQALALAHDFETFALESFDHSGHARPIESYFLLDGRIPENLRVIRVETLSADLNQVLRNAGIGSEMPVIHDNVSFHENYACYYTEAGEEAVYRRYRWVFDQGFYPRIDRSSFRFVEESPSFAQRLPLEGAVSQVGPPNGFWPEGSEGWLEQTFSCKLRALQHITHLTVRGWFSHEYSDLVHLRMVINGASYCHDCVGRGFLDWTMTCELLCGELAEISLRCSAVHCPKDCGAMEDDRKISFLLLRMKFFEYESPSEAGNHD